MAYETILFKRGHGTPDTLSPGEPAFDLENLLLYIGSESGNVLITGGGGGGGSGTVTTMSVVTVNGISGSVANATTTPAITLALGAITPTSVAASGNVTGANLSGTNTGDQNLSGYVPTTRTINGDALSSNVTISTITGNAGTATALQTARTIGITGDIVYTSTGFDGSANASAAGTLATVNSNVGSFGGGASIPSLTVNAKGLITAVSGNAVTAPAGALTGTTLAANVLASSLTSVGSLTAGSAGSGFTIALSSVTLTGAVPTARLGGGTADSSSYLRGDQTWATVEGYSPAQFAVDSAASPAAGTFTTLSGLAGVINPPSQFGVSLGSSGLELNRIYAYEISASNQMLVPTILVPAFGTLTLGTQLVSGVGNYGSNGTVIELKNTTTLSTVTGGARFGAIIGVMRARHSNALEAGIGGVLFVDYTTTSTTSTNGTEDDLNSHTTIASTLGADGDSIEQVEHVSFVGSATAARRLKRYFGGTPIFDSGSLTLTLGGEFTLRTTIIRESSSIVRCDVAVTSTSASTLPYSTYTRIMGLTLSSTNILKTTGIASGTGAASGDISNTMSRISWHPA